VRPSAASAAGGSLLAQHRDRHRSLAQPPRLIARDPAVDLHAEPAFVAAHAADRVRAEHAVDPGLDADTGHPALQDPDVTAAIATLERPVAEAHEARVGVGGGSEQADGAGQRRQSSAGQRWHVVVLAFQSAYPSVGGEISVRGPEP